MQVTTFTKKLAEIEKTLFEEYLGKKIPQIEKYLKHFDTDLVKLNVTAEKFHQKNSYKVEMFLDLPKASKQSLYASEDSHDLRKAIDFAKSKLIEQIKKAIDKLQNEHLRAT